MMMQRVFRTSHHLQFGRRQCSCLVTIDIHLCYTNPNRGGKMCTRGGKTRTRIEWSLYYVLILHTKAPRQHDVETSRPRKLSLHASRFGKPRCSHVSKEKRVSDAPMSITIVRGTQSTKHGRCVVRALGSIDLAMAAGWASPCLFSFACALRRSVSSRAIRPSDALSLASTSRCRAVSRASRVRGL